MFNRREWLKSLGLLALAGQFRPTVDAATADFTMDSPTSWVNPFIGTGAHGHTYPGASVPFGMAQLSPDNGVAGWDWCSGYNYASDTIKCFSHTHLSGTGIGDMYDIGLMPTYSQPDSPISWPSKFSHSSENAAPGYYAVTLAEHGIRAELTATERIGVHRYTFPKQYATIVFDLAHSLNWDTPTDCLFQVENHKTISGYRYSKGWARNQKLYFVATFSHPFTSIQPITQDKTGVNWLSADGILWSAQSPDTDAKMNGTQVRAALKFNSQPNEQIIVKVGLSPVSIKNAKSNLTQEVGASGFETLRAKARAAWEKPLNCIAIESDDNDAKTVFYTALYHTMLAPTIFCDADKSYRGPDGNTHHPLERSKFKVQSSNPQPPTPNPHFQNYSTYSLWDTFRAAHPLFTLTQPGRVNDLVQSMMAFYRQNGTLPVWSLAGNETGTMIGYHSVPVIVDAYAKGLAKIDPLEALAAMKQSALQRRLGLQYYQMPEPTTLEELQKAAAREELPRIGTIDEKTFDDKTLWQYGRLVPGYAKTISGPNIHYHSAYPHVKEALIARCEDGKNVIEWETPPARPANEGGTADAVTFVWLAGIDVDGDGHRFDLFVNGDKWFAFNNPKTAPPHSFNVTAANGAKLDFHATHQDQFGDLFGYMFLTVPRRLLTVGQPLRLKVVGEKANADDWYMTFAYKLGQSGFQMVAENLFSLVTHEGEVKHAVKVYLEYLGIWAAYGQLILGNEKALSFPVRFGAQTIIVLAPLVKEITKTTLFFKVGHEPGKGSSGIYNYGFKLRPVHPFDYIPCELENESVSKTLEYAYDDWCIAEFARKIGAKDDAAFFTKRSQFYRNLFDNTTGFMRGKHADGSWREPFSPKFSEHRQDDYTEGNAWQYSWSVMHDVPGLIELMGGREAFVKKLDQLFAESSDIEGTNASPDISGLIGQYAHGNEPSHHIAYLYALAGYAWKTQERVRQITSTLYHNTPKGLCGNEDCGQMSAWYIFSALGFYPVNPASGIYIIGSPHFPQATLKLGNKQFLISAQDVSDTHFYIQSATLNGKPFSRCWITHQEIVAGGTLSIEMGDKPNKKWGQAQAN